MSTLQVVAHVVLIGIGATIVLDLWLIFLQAVGVQALDFAPIGRWVGHLFRGQLLHASIGLSPPIPGERAWGWLTHYAVGIAFAGLLVAVQGPAWTQSPSVLPAVAVGMATVAFPLLVMQPAMGGGFASSKTPTPVKNCFRSLANHTVFGLGLYIAAALIAPIHR